MKRHSSVFGFLPIPQVLLPPSDSSPRFVFLPRAVTPIISRGVHIMHRKREIAHEYYKLAHHPGPGCWASSLAGRSRSRRSPRSLSSINLGGALLALGSSFVSAHLLSSLDGGGGAPDSSSLPPRRKRTSIHPISQHHIATPLRSARTKRVS